MASKTGVFETKILVVLISRFLPYINGENDGQQLQQHETRMMARDNKEHNNDDKSPPASNAGGFFSFCYYLAVLNAPKKNTLLFLISLTYLHDLSSLTHLSFKITFPTYLCWRYTYYQGVTFTITWFSRVYIYTRLARLARLSPSCHFSLPLTLRRRFSLCYTIHYIS